MMGVSWLVFPPSPLLLLLLLLLLSLSCPLFLLISTANVELPSLTGLSSLLGQCPAVPSFSVVSCS